jgi:alkylation response protein AidB-like acyl-CoA dehydrogenase
MNQQSGNTSHFYADWEEKLSPEEARHIQRVRDFCDEVLSPFILLSERDRLPMQKSIVREWGRLGMPGLQSPESRGGLGGSYFAKIRMVHELASRSFACAFSLNNMHSLVTTFATRAPVQIADRYLPGLLSGELVASVALTEPGGGSDLLAMKTHARKVSGGWRLNGEKAWIANASIADVMIVSAQTGEGAAGVARFVVDMNSTGVIRRGTHALSAGHATGVGGVAFEDVYVPDECLMEAPGEGFRIGMEGINAARIHVGAMCVAVLQRSLAVAVEYAGVRSAFGKPLLGHQGLRWMLVDVATDLEAANLLVLRGADFVHRRVDATLPAAHAKKFSASIAVRGVEKCMQSMGAAAMLSCYPLGRQLAEIKMAAYADGTTEIQNERIGKYLHSHYC